MLHNYLAGQSICLLLNLWTFFTAEPLRLSVAAEPLDFLYCWTFEISCLLLNLWIFFTAGPLRLSVCCWTFGFSLLLNLWDYLFAAEPLNFLYCWTFDILLLLICLLLNLWTFFTAEPSRRFSSKQNHQNSGHFLSNWMK